MPQALLPTYEEKSETDPYFFGIAEGKPIPTELRQEANALNEEIQLEDEITARRASCPRIPRRDNCKIEIQK